MSDALTLPEKIIRTKRKSIALIIERDGALVVRAPRWASDDDIMRVIAKKRSWIIKKQELFRMLPVCDPKHRFLPGEAFFLLGKQYTLTFSSRLRPSLVFDGINFSLSRSKLGKAKESFIVWYKKFAMDYISRRATHFATLHSIRYRSVKITSARTRWGSCTTRGDLNFSYRLVIAPPAIIDYVIVHELCHIGQMNHSRGFWINVGAILPDFRERRKWLNAYGKTLTIE